MKIMLAIVLGGAFGFVLQRAGATNASNIINMLALRDLTIAKMILLAIAVSSAAIFTLHAVDPGLVHLSIKKAYLGVVVGGVIFGLGFAIAGYCPGTSLCALGEGKRDAVLFVLGGLLGALAYTLVYGYIKGSMLFEPIGGGKATLARIADGSATTVPGDLPAIVVAGAIALVLVVVAILLPRRKRRATAANHDVDDVHSTSGLHPTR